MGNVNRKTGRPSTGMVPAPSVSTNSSPGSASIDSASSVVSSESVSLEVVSSGSSGSDVWRLRRGWSVKNGRVNVVRDANISVRLCACTRKP
eukprot:8095345-Pyramimonas_sp.AAC.2